MRLSVGENTTKLSKKLALAEHMLNATGASTYSICRVLHGSGMSDCERGYAGISVGVKVKMPKGGVTVGTNDDDDGKQKATNEKMTTDKDKTKQTIQHVAAVVAEAAHPDNDLTEIRGCVRICRRRKSYSYSVRDTKGCVVKAANTIDELLEWVS
jgi:hypothetical protein